VATATAAAPTRTSSVSASPTGRRCRHRSLPGRRRHAGLTAATSANCAGWARRLNAHVDTTGFARRSCSAIAFRSLSASSASTVMAHHSGGSVGCAPSRVAHQCPPLDTHGCQPGNSRVMADWAAAVSSHSAAGRDTPDSGTAVRLLPSVDQLGHVAYKDPLLSVGGHARKRKEACTNLHATSAKLADATRVISARHARPDAARVPAMLAHRRWRAALRNYAVSPLSATGH